MLFYPANSPKNQNLKKWKKHPEISSFKTCNTNYDQIMCGSWDMVCEGCTDGQTDGKSDISGWPAIFAMKIQEQFKNISLLF